MVQLLEEGERILKGEEGEEGKLGGVRSPRLEAEVLLKEAAGVRREENIFSLSVREAVLGASEVFQK